jgi:creatinine amidohydrolase
MLSLADKGFSRIVVMNGHGGHLTELKNAATRVHRQMGAKVAVIHWWILCEKLTEKFFGEAGGHAGLDENAAMLAINPKLVKKARYKKNMAFSIKEGVYCLPAPGTILIYKEGEGYPQFDRKKAEMFMKRVVEKVKEELLTAFDGWDRLKS